MDNQVNPRMGLDTANQWIEKNFANFISLLQGGIKEFYERISAEITLHPELRDGVTAHLVTPSDEDYKARYTRVARAQYRSLVHALYRVWERDGFDFVAAMTPEMNEEIYAAQVLLGFRKADPRPPKPKSAAELLTIEVLQDFNGVKGVKPPISTKVMQEKRRTRRDYDAEYRRLAETDELTSQITTAYDAGEVGG